MQSSIPPSHDATQAPEARSRAADSRPNNQTPKKNGARAPKTRNPTSSKKLHAPPVWEDAVNKDEIGEFGADGRFIDSFTSANPAHDLRSQSAKHPVKKAPAKRSGPTAWQETQVSKEETGYFSADGRYIDPSVQSTDHAAVSDSATVTNPRRGKPTKRVNGQTSLDLSSPVKTGSPADVTKKRTVFTPAKGQAYAGPGFHASPAASALPIPKFFSKSVPSASANGLQSRLDAETAKQGEPLEPAEAPVPIQVQAAKAVTREESPLDLFFNAARKEQANGRTGSGLPTPSSADILPRRSEPPKNHYATIYGGNYNNHHRHVSHDSNREMFMMELDGSNTAVDSPSRGPPQSNPRNGAAHPVGPVPYPRQMYAQAPTHDPSGRTHSPLASPPTSGPHPTAEQSPFYRPSPQLYRTHSNPHTPASVTTPPNPHPPPGPTAANNSPYHYGNRNLSPLFKAAKSPPTAVTDYKRASLLRNVALPIPGDGSPPHAGRRDNEEVRRISTQYLEQQVHRSDPHIPPIDLSSVAAPARGPVELGETTPTRGAGEGTRDVKRLEESLRKMLDLK